LKSVKIRNPDLGMHRLPSPRPLLQLTFETFKKPGSK
jgi:hypothetical protein